MKPISRLSRAAFSVSYTPSNPNPPQYFVRQVNFFLETVILTNETKHLSDKYDVRGKRW